MGSTIYGDIVGYYSAPNGELQGFLTTPAPEASTWAIMLLGFVGLGFASLARGEERSSARDSRTVKHRRHSAAAALAATDCM